MNMLRIALIALAVQLLAQQQPPVREGPPGGSIEGMVVKLGTGEPLAGAKVQLDLAERSVRRSGPAGPPGPPGPPPPGEIASFHRSATTDRDGKFIFENVTPGDYQLIATREGGYVPAEYGQRTATGRGINFELAGGQKFRGIVLAMSPTGSISGRVYDRSGEPLGRAQVQALRPVYKNGRRAMTIVQTVETNDRGEYRLFWLAPGRYYVSARPDIPQLPMNPAAGPGTPAAAGSVGGRFSSIRITDPARFGTFEQASNPIVKKRTTSTGEVVEETYVQTYYPGTIDSQAAAPIALGAGAMIGGVDISTGTGLVPARHIRGRVINAANGQPAAGVAVLAIPRTLEPQFNIPRGLSNPDGFFDMPGVVTGSYLVFADNRSMSGMVPVEMGNTDVANVPVVITSGFTVSGRFVVEGRSRSGNDPRVSDLRVNAFTRDPEMLGMPSGGPGFNPPAAADGSFRLEGVSPGDFRVTIRGVPPDAYVKSIRMGNADVLDGGLHLYAAPENLLEVVIGASAGRIAGSVVNTRQEPLANRTVVLVPDVRLRHRSDLYRTASTDSSGAFRLEGLTPGDYKLFAWEEAEAGAWMDPDFIRGHESRGKQVQVSEGSDENHQLTVIP